MTGRPDTTDPLDRMEHDGNRFFDLSWLGENGLSAGVLYETASDLAEHLLALVAVARAARKVEGWHPIDRGWDDPAFHPQHRDAVLELREALARLDGAR